MVLERSKTTGRGWDGHLLMLHDSESERVSGLVAWIRRGLANNEKVICGQALAEPEERAVLPILSRHGMDVAALTAAGRLAVVPLPEFYLSGGQRQVVEKALAEGYRAVRITCEAAAALTFLTWSAYMDTERGIDEICRTHPVSALCQYQQAATEDDRLRELTEAHLDGIRQRLLATGPEHRGLALVGEIDMSNEGVLSCALQAAMSRAVDTFHLELSGLRFLSAAGCRVLSQGTRQFRDRGGRLLLIGPTAGVAEMLRLTGLDRQLNVELVRSRP